MKNGLVKTLLLAGLISGAAAGFTSCDLHPQEPSPTPSSQSSSYSSSSQSSQDSSQSSSASSAPKITKISGDIYNTTTGLIIPEGVAKLDEIVGNNTNFLSDISKGNGHFETELTNWDNPELIVKAKFGDSYTRTMPADGTTGTNAGVYVSPAPTFCSKAEYKQQQMDINSTRSHAEISKWKIFSDNSGNGSFTPDQITLMSNKICADNDIEALVAGREFDNSIEVVHGSPSMSSESNYVYVIPNANIYGGNSGRTFNWYSGNGRTIYKSKIEIDPDCVREDNPTFTHEAGHVFIAPDGEATHLSGGYTIMNYNTTSTIPLSADIKAGEDLYKNPSKDATLEEFYGLDW